MKVWRFIYPGRANFKLQPDLPVHEVKELKSWNATEFGENGGYYYASQITNALVEQYGLETVLEILKTGDSSVVIGKLFEEVYSPWAAVYSEN